MLLSCPPVQINRNVAYMSVLYTPNVGIFYDVIM